MTTENVVTIVMPSHLRVLRCAPIQLSKQEFKELPRTLQERWHKMSNEERWLAIHDPKPPNYCTDHAFFED